VRFFPSRKSNINPTSTFSLRVGFASLLYGAEAEGSTTFLALREIEWVVSPKLWADYANKKGKIQREREHSEREWHKKKMGMIPPR